MSSTAIRRAVEAGDFATAAQMLGREYTILGTVESGKQLGRSLGFPTANLSAHSEQFPPNGVYAAEAQLEGKSLRGVINLGVRPTVERRFADSVCSSFTSSISTATSTAATSKSASCATCGRSRNSKTWLRCASRSRAM